MDYCFAVNRDNTVLYSILAKAAGVVSSSTINAALTHYFAEDARVTTADDPFSRDIPIAIACVLTALVLVLLLLLHSAKRSKKNAESRELAPTREDFVLFDDIPLSYSVYHVIHVEHSELYDAQIVYANHAFERLGGLSVEAVVGRYVRDLYPYIGEEWFQHARRAACDGQTVEFDYVDPLGGRTYRFMAKQVICPDYCAVTYQET